MRLMRILILLVAVWTVAATLLNGSGASLSTQARSTSQTNSPASAKQYKLGETIHLREGLTLKIVSGSPKSVELFTSKQVVTAKSFVLDLQFDIQPPAGGEAVAFELGESADKSVFLNVGEASLMPTWWGWFPPPGSWGKPTAGRVEEGLHVLGALPSGKGIATFLFELDSTQMKRKKTLPLKFKILPKELFSLLIDLESKSN